MRNVQPCEVSALHDGSYITADIPRVRCLGIENKKGTLRPGADADLVVLDRKGKVLSTWVAGHEVWKRQSS